jgi:squalene synthase HpnC
LPTTAYPLQAIPFLAHEEAMSRRFSPAEAQAYTHWLATHHYENFHVVSLFLPKTLHQDFFNVYAFCRWADDLGDETGSTARSLELLEWWRGQLAALYERGEAAHPVFVALAETNRRHALPREPFDHLIAAFVQDQTVTRYRNWDEVFGYCVNSANPVGRLVLQLGGYDDERRVRLSDATCTALQLANFWQDVTVDLKKDRVYLPLDLLAKHGYSVEELFARRTTPAFRAVMREAVEVAAGLFREGLPLAATLGRRLALDVDLFSRGGMRVLERIRALDYDVLAGRPAIGRTERVRLLLGSLARVAFRKAA